MATIVEAVTEAINMDNDTWWSIHYSQMNNWERDYFLTHAHVMQSSDQSADYIRMDMLTRNPGSMKIWA